MYTQIIYHSDNYIMPARVRDLAIALLCLIIKFNTHSSVWDFIRLRKNIANSSIVHDGDDDDAIVGVSFDNDDFWKW